MEQAGVARRPTPGIVVKGEVVCHTPRDTPFKRINLGDMPFSDLDRVSSCTSIPRMFSPIIMCYVPILGHTRSVSIFIHRYLLVPGYCCDVNNPEVSTTAPVRDRMCPSTRHHNWDILGPLPEKVNFMAPVGLPTSTVPSTDLKKVLTKFRDSPQVKHREWPRRMTDLPTPPTTHPVFRDLTKAQSPTLWLQKPDASPV